METLPAQQLEDAGIETTIPSIAADQSFKSKSLSSPAPCDRDD